MNKGKVKTWRFSWGFITNDETGKDIFVHKNDLNGGIQELQVGKAVTYDVGTDEKNNKEKAINVSIISD